MKRLVMRLIGLAVVAAVPFLAFLTWMPDGTADYYHRRFSTSRAGSLLLGTSRMAHAVRPELWPPMRRAGYAPLFNFAMTLGHSPYGPVYLRLIKEKLDTTGSEPGLFVLGVSPLGMAKRHSNPEDDPGKYREATLFTGDLKQVNGFPNWEYFLRFYGKPYYALLTQRLDPPVEYLHDDGWLEVKAPYDTAVFALKSKVVAADFRARTQRHTFSERRLAYLAETIAFLKRHGQVVLLRTPISPEMLAVEEAFVPDFDQRIDSLAAVSGVRYFNWSRDTSYQTTDGSHLWVGETGRFNQALRHAILRAE